MSTINVDGEDDHLRSRKQQSVLASKRVEPNTTPTETNRTGKLSGYFPLGYKDGFSQWVRDSSSLNIKILLIAV